MATTIYGLDTYTAHAKLSAASWNEAVQALDRVGRVLAAPRANGVVSGWQFGASASTVTSGAGVVGPNYCKTTAAQSISGLVNGTNYVFARAKGGSPASGTVDFVARASTSAITNADGVTYATRIGYIVKTAGAISGVHSSGTAVHPRDKLFTTDRNALVAPGGFTGLTTTQALLDGMRYSGAVLQYRTRTITLKGGLVTAVATTGAWTTVPTV